MGENNHYDIIIAGAGAAGLSLLWRILESTQLREWNILLIDKTFNPSPEKTWCFWEDLDLPSPGLIYHSWDKLQVRIKNQLFTETLQHHHYNCLRSRDFTNSVLEKAKNCPNLTFLEAEIHDFSHTEKTGTTHTSKGNYTAKFVFQSVKNPPDFNNLTVDISLIQHFKGWEIETSYDCFDKETATFMDFDVPQKDGVTFMYLLPFSKRNALVEYTVFSETILKKEEYERSIQSYLRDNFGLINDHYSIRREEFGAIPMEDRKYPAWYCRNVLNLGTVAGVTKPSTGYAFSRIQKHSEKIVLALETGSPQPVSLTSMKRFKIYDMMMLYLMKFETENSLIAFKNLFKKNQFETVLQFLAEETNLLQELVIFSGMPYRPFMRSIYHMKHRIFTMF